MRRSIFQFPDGTEITSGLEAVPAIRTVTYSQQVCSQTDFAYGGAAAAMVEVTLIDPTDAATLPAGEFFYYEEAPDGTRQLLGIFTPEAMVRTGPHACRFTAYDRMIRLDRDMTQWLSALTGWPYTMEAFLSLVCDCCGLTLQPQTRLPNGSYPAARFLGSFTARELIAFIAGANAAYAHITPQGELAFSAFTAAQTVVGAQCRLLEVERFTTAPIARVQVSQTDSDAGVSVGEGETYRIVGNPMLTAASAEALLPCVQTLYQRLEGFCYTPARLEIFGGEEIHAGQLLTVQMPDGTAVTTPVFTLRRSGDITAVASTGNPNRHSGGAVTEGYRQRKLGGRMSQVSMDMEKLQGQVSQVELGVDRATTALAALELNAQGINASVEKVEQDLASAAEGVNDSLASLTRRVEASVTPEAVSLQIRQELANGVDKVSTATGYRFDDTGMTVEKSGSATSTQITENGMTIYRGSVSDNDRLLTANKDGVDAQNLHATTYLTVGQYSRFEDYGGRTGCFWIGG